MNGIIEMVGRFTARCDACSQVFNAPADTWSIGLDGTCVACSRVSLTLTPLDTGKETQEEIDRLYDEGFISSDEYHERSIIITEERV